MTVHNYLRLYDYLLHLLGVLPEHAEQSNDFEIADLLPWSEDMKSWSSVVLVLGTYGFSVPRDY